MSKPFSDAELAAYIDEELAAGRASELEEQLREDVSLQDRLVAINTRRNSGVHTLGEIWRRHRIGVPTREELGSYLLGVLDPEHTKYIDFRLKILCCPLTIANLNDLKNQQQGEPEVETRKMRYFQSSVGFLEEGQQASED